MAKRKAFTIEEKAAIICRLENGGSNNDVAKEFDVSKIIYILVSFRNM